MINSLTLNVDIFFDKVEMTISATHTYKHKYAFNISINMHVTLFM